MKASRKSYEDAIIRLQYAISRRKEVGLWQWLTDRPAWEGARQNLSAYYSAATEWNQCFGKDSDPDLVEHHRSLIHKAGVLLGLHKKRRWGK